MPCWYYEKKELRHTPSVNQGMVLEEEIMYRREGARFILQLGNKMGLRYETMATGVVYFHRFYMVHTFQEFPRHVTACCCLFLAGKVEETPKKCKDIMRHARSLIDDATWAEFGTDPREEVMTLERILLQTIKFDFIVEHPYSYLLKYAKCLKGDKKKLQSMVQMAWTFVNDGLCTTLCLQWEPEIIAIALMYLSGKLNKFEVTDWQGRNPRHQKWWDMFVQGISMELLEDICHQVLDLYSPNKSESSSSTAVTTMPGPSMDAVTAVTPTKVADSAKSPSPGSAPPPAKKSKKEEVKIASSPAKVETPVTQSYTYPYTAYAGYPPSYPPPPATTPTVATPPPPRYPYAYPPTASPHPPPQSVTPTHLPAHTPAHPPAHPTPPPATYQPPPPPARYTPSGSASSNTSVPPPHYAAQAPPPGHYGAAHPPPYPPPAGAAPLYPPPQATHSRPPPSHYSHGNSASSYYPPTTPTGTTLPPSYQQPSTSSYPAPSSSYGHSSSRPYYPPST